MEKLDAVRREGLKEKLPEFRPGDSVRVMVRVREGDKERLQAFEGVCIARRGGGVSACVGGGRVPAGVGGGRFSPWPSPGTANRGVGQKGGGRGAMLSSGGQLWGRAPRTRGGREAAGGARAPAPSDTPA